MRVIIHFGILGSPNLVQHSNFPQPNREHQTVVEWQRLTHAGLRFSYAHTNASACRGTSVPARRVALAYGMLAACCRASEKDLVGVKRALKEWPSTPRFFRHLARKRISRAHDNPNAFPEIDIKSPPSPPLRASSLLVSTAEARSLPLRLH